MKAVATEDEPIAIVNLRGSFVHVPHPSGDDRKSKVVPGNGYVVIDDPEDIAAWKHSYRLKRFIKDKVLQMKLASEVDPPISPPQGDQYELYDPTFGPTVDQIRYGPEEIALQIIRVAPKRQGVLQVDYLKTKHLPILHQALYYEEKGGNKDHAPRPHFVAELQERIKEITFKYTN